MMTHRHRLALALLAVTLLGCEPFLKCVRGEGDLRHVADEVVDLAARARSQGVLPDSSDWRAVIAGLIARVGACLVKAASEDLSAHLAAEREGQAVRATCARCLDQHHGHLPDEGARSFYEAAARQAGERVKK